MRLVTIAGAVTALALTAGTAGAADLYNNSGASTKDPQNAVAGLFPASTAAWSGFYAGVNSGWGFGDDQTIDATLNSAGTIAPKGAIITATGIKDDGMSGLFGGIQGGYQVQYNWLVLGAEADFHAGDVSSSKSTAIDTLGTMTIPDGETMSLTAKSSMDWFGSVRGRVGVAFGNALLYGSGGFAYADISSKLSGVLSDGTDSTRGSISHDSVRTGSVYGGGGEYKLNDKWSIKAEYLHWDFGRESFSSPVSVISPGDTAATKLGTASTSVKTEVNTVIFGANYHF